MCCQHTIKTDKFVDLIVLKLIQKKLLHYLHQCWENQSNVATFFLSNN